jgi:hypothetical protein
MRPSAKSTNLPIEGEDRDKVKLSSNPVVKLRMIRDYNQNLYFAEQDGKNRTEIINIFMDADTGLNRKVIYYLHGCQIIALELNNSNI